MTTPAQQPETPDLARLLDVPPGFPTIKGPTQEEIDATGRYLTAVFESIAQQIAEFVDAVDVAGRPLFDLRPVLPPHAEMEDGTL